ncbi:type II secretion system secretin GspD [Verminephrobacter aporrectodeae]|uniref:Type II secretion system protein GspD n=3 Tax=Verminephrobacter TaxID=364316 RepID=A0ABT3KU09_9BURK|nr:type II secretion system secretin GspD [Verminephrobacter aporrectodeae]MCW5222349.1 type II secretion system protein GspD [Verminephrobacter aporrectodeae subsp. tuberculatae]MCW5257438.1 type II secretion system protein GspD [Verminephrobacter aporrectodeae subsp. tuberculatae]MCW5287813.1 type II secretion system protein GspD [Verminephrobacter aporrectodeae subsp. tuberculatae]MCW5321379.1 type II secretion system protein GspD [Verminephrobacter aporrectodeae subsp. tuberculatae]MCW8164
MTCLISPRLRSNLETTLKTLAATALLACASGQTAAQTASSNPPSVRAGEPVTLNFTNAEIEAVARTMATITGRNVVVDPRVKGQLNLLTEHAVPPAVAFQQFLAALRLQGFTVVESAGLYKVVPEADAKLQGGSVSVVQGDAGSAPGGGQIVTQIFKLNYENATNLIPVLRPLISPNNTINVNPGNNSLVITDYADNLQRLARIVAAMDVSNASDVEVIPLHNAVASDLAPLVARLIEGGSSTTPAAAPGQSDTAFKTTLLAEPRSNALILRAANPARAAQVRSLVERLDQPPTPGSGAAQGNIHVVYLRNAEATKLATTLRAALAAMGGSGGSASSPAASGPALATPPTTGLSGNSSANNMAASSADSNQPSTGGQIQADPSTNSLVITAPEPVYRQLRAVIDKLDGRRAQVLVESLIVEVSTNKLAQFGIQWQSLLGQKGSTIGLIGTNSGQAGSNILTLTAAAASGSKTALGSALSTLGNGMNLALAPRINGQYYLGALANFLQNSGDANVLSTPTLMTLDNEEAKIVIGSNVPFITGSYANNTGSSSVNPFNTIERKDVGLMLRVRPQISENGTVKMAIYQEVSKIDRDTTKDANGPTTSKRSIESNVVVDDGNIIVIGGLLEDSYAQAEDKVPFMGDLPVVGSLFRSEYRSRKKINLMVFLRPTVVRDNAASDALSIDRYESIRALQQSTQPAPNWMLRNVDATPELPVLPASLSLPRERPDGAQPTPPDGN